MALRELQSRNVLHKPWSKEALHDAFLASNKGDVQALKTLAKAFKAPDCSSGTDTLIQARDKKGSTLLHAAAAASQWQVVDYLLRQGASVNITNNLGQSAMHIACSNGDTAIIKRLYQSGGRFSSPKDGLGRRPFDCAVSCNMVTPEMARMVEEEAGIQIDCSPARCTQQARLVALSTITGISSKGEYLTLARTKMGRLRLVENAAAGNLAETMNPFSETVKERTVSCHGQRSSLQENESTARISEEEVPRRKVRFTDRGKENDTVLSEYGQSRGIKQLVRNFIGLRRSGQPTIITSGPPGQTLPTTSVSTEKPMNQTWEQRRERLRTLEQVPNKTQPGASVAADVQVSVDESGPENSGDRPSTPSKVSTTVNTHLGPYTSPLVPLPMTAIGCPEDVNLFSGKSQFSPDSPPSSSKATRVTSPKALRFESTFPRKTPSKSSAGKSSSRSLSPIREEKMASTPPSAQSRGAPTAPLNRLLFSAGHEADSLTKYGHWYVGSSSDDGEASDEELTDSGSLLQDLLETNTINAGRTPGIKPSTACTNLRQLFGVSSDNNHAHSTPPPKPQRPRSSSSATTDSIKSKSINSNATSDDSGHGELRQSQCSSAASLTLPSDTELSGGDESFAGGLQLSSSKQELLETRISNVDVERMFTKSPEYVSSIIDEGISGIQPLQRTA